MTDQAIIEAIARRLCLALGIDPLQEVFVGEPQRVYIGITIGYQANGPAVPAWKIRMDEARAVFEEIRPLILAQQVLGT